MSRSTKKITKLKEDDWNDLFPGQEFTIGTTSFFIEPLGLKSVALIMNKVSSIAIDIARLDVSMADFKDGSIVKIASLVHLIVLEAPEILSEMSGLDSEDVKDLPIDIAVELFNKCLDVNLQSKESLLKNFKELGVKLEKFMGAEEALPEQIQDSEA